MKTRKPKPLLGSTPASAACAVAIRELLKVKAAQAILAKKSALLRELIILNDCGMAHGCRTYLYYKAPSRRWVCTKGGTVLVVKPGDKS